MKPFAPKALGFFCLLASTGALHAVDLQNLVDRSPFSPASQSADGTGVAEPQGTWEFRGMATDAEGTAYSIFDTTTNKGRWVRAEDSNSPVQIKGFDPANNTLEIEQDGRALRLALKRAVIQSGQSVSAMTAAGVQAAAQASAPERLAGAGRRAGGPGGAGGLGRQGRQGQAQAQGQAQTPKLDPSVQKERLQSLAETVRRNREQRQAAIAKARQNAQGQVPAASTNASGS